MTQGSGYFTRKFVRYEEVPEMLVHKIIEEYKKKRIINVKMDKDWSLSIF